MAFRAPWRPYQARVLDKLPALLGDGRLHVVAAPGSGKTVLGLELFRHLRRPTVVLSPTRTIRDQWVSRLADFLPGSDPFALTWTSRDLNDLCFFNSLTYQALHTRAREASGPTSDTESLEAQELNAEETGAGPSTLEVDEVVHALRAAGVRSVILDEAHHLRSEWWLAIQDIVSRLDEVTLVSLTATPPYDVVGREWTRYIELCGPIDEEISVPELVKAGTLCPHEDYVWLTQAEGREKALLRDHQQAVRSLRRDLTGDQQFLAELAAHPWATRPAEHASEVANNPDTAMALAEVLRAATRPSPLLLDLLDAGDEDFPAEPSDGCWELVLRLYLYGDPWSGGPDPNRRRSLAQRLRGEGLLVRRQFALAKPGHKWPQLSLSTTKIDACVRITELERRERGETLREVILVDYIRDDGYTRTDEDREQSRSGSGLGAWPIFQRLAAVSNPREAAGLVMHTGRLSIVHATLLPALQTALSSASLQARPVPALPHFRAVTVDGAQGLTGAFTHLLAAGHITVLVGTRALLGEGWDAPAVNSLILASFVGSFMTTNQMRGRAIRTDPAQPDKMASIWHLGTTAKLHDEQWHASELRPWDTRDLDDMARRFQTFVGVDEQQPVITGGLDRLRMSFYRDGQCRTPIDVDAHNADMVIRLGRRAERAEQWRVAIDSSDLGLVLPAVHVPTAPRFRPLLFEGTLRALLLQLLGIVLVLLTPIMSARTTSALGGVLLITGIGLAVFALPKTIRLGLLFLRHLPVDGSVRAIALAVRDALCSTGLLSATLRRSDVLIRQDHFGHLYVALAAGTFAERSTFADAIHQVLAPIDRPRYLITRRQPRRVGRSTDFHAVPSLLGSKADRAQAFLRAWHRRVSPAELIYTRSDEGRLALIRARSRSYVTAAAATANRMERMF